MRGKDAIKCAALLKGSGSLFRRKRFIVKCRGRNKIRNNPATAMTNFLEMDEKIILYIDSGFNWLNQKIVSGYKFNQKQNYNIIL